MDRKTNDLLVIDAWINLALGVLLLAFPAGIPVYLGIPNPTTYFYSSILGAILFGIGIALLLERYLWSIPSSGLGLMGAIAINLCGGFALLFWLISGRSGSSGMGELLLWMIALLVLATGTVELVSIARERYNKGGLPESTIKEQVLRRELDWTRAHQELDLAAVEEILADEYQQRQPDGSFKGKLDLIKSYRSGNRFWEIAESSDHHVELFDDLAIVIGRWRGKGINTGEPFDYTARFLSIYRKADQSWKMILDISLPESS